MIISMQVKEALKDRSFLQNGRDANVSGPCDPAPACSMPLTISLTPCSLQGQRNNLAHPAIKEIIVQFFYTADNALARTFPEDFKDEVPEDAIASVMTYVCISRPLQVLLAHTPQIQLCLEEWKAGIRQEVGFDGENYKIVHNSLLNLINEVKSNPYHGLKFSSNQRKWAQTGMYEDIILSEISLLTFLQVFH